MLYLWVTPLLETPDEPSHFSVVKYIADKGHLPPARSAPSDAGPVPVILPGPPVYYAPPLYYVLGAPLIVDLETDGFAAAVVPNPNWARGWAPTPDRSPENKHIYVHTADQRPPYTGWAAAMVRLRVFSLLLGGATVSGVYALARALWASPTKQSWVLATTALVAFNPAFLFVTIGVTNDALLIALSTWAFVLMAWLVGRPANQRPWSLAALLGIVMGLGTLTKQSMLAFLPVAALALVWGARSQPRPRPTALKQLLVWATFILLLAGWWYLRNTMDYGDPLGFQPHQTPAGAWQPPLSLLLRQVGQALRGYWGAFGWGLILVDPIIYVLVAAFVVVGLTGWLRSQTTDHQLPTRRAETQDEAADHRLPAILALGVLLNLIGLVLWLWRTSAPYGRLLFPTLGPLAVLLVLGWQRWLGHGRGRPFAWGVTLTLGLYAVIVPWRYLQPAYASPVVSPSAVEDATPLNVHFDKTLRLLGHRMNPEVAKPGDRVTLTLYWQAMTSLEDNLTAFVHLAPRDPQQWVAGLDDHLGSSRYPSRVWQKGEVIEQVHQLRLPDDAPAPALYWFSVGLYVGPGGERLPVTADGAPLPYGAVWLGPLRVQSERPWQPRQRVDYRLGSTIRLTGYDVDTSRASSVTVTLYWQAVAVPEGDWIVFVHLLDADGHLVAQDDAPPRQGDYPTWAWLPGDRVLDHHTLSLPPNLSPGTFQLQVGLYRPDDGARIPVFDQADRRVPDDVAFLTDIALSGKTERDEH
jgi:4-amino-4-deoxy-L-arabinose transferase-like glycosyltransferase